MSAVRCSICLSGEPGANVVNELLHGHERLRDISKQTGYSTSSISRHKGGACPFSFLRWRADRIKAKRKRGIAPSGPTFIRWHSLKDPNRIDGVQKIIIGSNGKPIRTWVDES